MRIWIDADACPRTARDALVRAAERTGIEVVFVANRHLHLPRVPSVRCVQVGRGFDVADEYIADQVAEGELVVTADIPLAHAALQKGAVCIDPRGQRLDEGVVNSRMAVRDLLEDLRAVGEVSGGPKPHSQRDTRRFAGELDRWLASLRR